MLNLDPRAVAIRRTLTEADYIRPPDESAAWTLVQVNTFPLPTPDGMGLALVCLWTAPRCRDCGAAVDPAESDVACVAGGLLLCGDCLQKTGGPMQAAQLCPVCAKPLPTPVNAYLAPYCSAECRVKATIGDGVPLAPETPNDAARDPHRCELCELFRPGPTDDAHTDGQCLRDPTLEEVSSTDTCEAFIRRRGRP